MIILKNLRNLSIIDIQIGVNIIISFQINKYVIKIIMTIKKIKVCPKSMKIQR